MIETDREIETKLGICDSHITEKEKNIKHQKIIFKIDIVCYIILYFFILNSTLLKKILFNKHIIQGILLVVIFYLFLYLHIKKSTYFDTFLEFQQIEINDLLNERKDIMDFCVYLTAYRQLEAKKHGFDIYPEIYLSDSEAIVKEYKDKFEQQRIAYEENHIKFLNLNKHYLDKKLQKAPISSYPICEHELLEKRKQELNGGNK